MTLLFFVVTPCPRHLNGGWEDRVVLCESQEVRRTLLACWERNWRRGGGGGEWHTTKYHGETREVESLEPVGGEENNQIIIMKRCHNSCHTTNQLTLMNHKK